MSKTKQFIEFTQKQQCSSAENIEAILTWIKKDQQITFLSWKMFNISNPIFDTVEADKFIDKEKEFIKTITNLKIRFNYFKLIPNELPKIFYNRTCTTQALKFSNQVKSYFQEIYPGTKVIRITQILTQSRQFKKTYDSVFRQSLKSTIDPEKLQREVIIRQDKIIALKAFGLFAAETAVILKYFQNPVLLASQRSIDTYKYEFYKYPPNRPVLPKLFVI